MYAPNLQWYTLVRNPSGVSRIRWYNLGRIVTTFAWYLGILWCEIQQGPGLTTGIL